MREGWEAATEDIDLNTYAQTHPALRAALSHFKAI
jgi:ribulose-bisphosphate carboxylase large chain